MISLQRRPFPAASRTRRGRLLVGALVLLVAAGIAYLLLRPKSPMPPAVPTSQGTQAVGNAGPVIELQAQDYTVLRLRPLQRSLPVSGTLRAVRSALVKARVSGELQELTLREGDSVQAGQVIARIDPAEYAARLRQARLQADAAKAQLDINQRQYDNNEALVQQGFISRTALDTSLAQLNAGRASYQASVAAADVAQKSADDTVLRAPMSGQIAQRLAQAGERVAIDARIVEIVDLSQMEIEAAISAADSVGVRVGQQARLQVEGMAEPLPARVVRINPSTQAGSRSVLIYLQLDARDVGKAGLRQGLFAQGTLATESSRAVAAPVSTVRYDKPQPYLQVLDQGMVRHLSVTLGLRGRDPSSGANSDEGELVAVQAVDGSPLEGRRVLQGVVGALREGTAVRDVSTSALNAAPGPGAPSR
ncbi:efflux RND transporter periplasmic adaptor subunit [Hylemonella gracilis]|uniref:Efflux RND transporter periplasmic adaptor subunit n=1 Tax=Hylemonella gracilis TaxID=80880 RepID=A0A4P6UM76_9BURK|nr:efflux RND transporter periplasmic adaptor subunit [Hylemonella gracilis]QBK04611.1 efflux RND transporter periplasmic adaptor subunit [Hylemonella gracilis]